MRRIKRPFEPKVIDVPQEGRTSFFAFVPNQIEEADFGTKWWPLLEGFPLNILYSSALQSQNIRPVMASALYEPDLRTFRETEATRELTYFNKQGGDYRVRAVLRKAGGLETSKYKGRKLIALAEGPDFDGAMVQTTMIGVQKDERVEVHNY